MDVPPVGAGPSAADLARMTGPGPTATPTAGTTAGQPASSPSSALDAAAWAALSEPDLARLLAVLEGPPSIERAAQFSAALQAAVSATAAGDAEQALAAVVQAVSLLPTQAEAVRSEPGLEPLRAQVDSLLGRLAQVARLDAEGRLAKAADLVETLGLKTAAEWEARPETLLLLAGQLLDAGGHANSVHAADLAQIVIDAAHWAPASAPTLDSPIPGAAGWERILGGGAASMRQDRARTPGRIKKLWKRAPLLVLLLAWLALGLAGGAVSLLARRVVADGPLASLISAGFDLWALGFLALVLFGFYTRVRNVRL